MLSAAWCEPSGVRSAGSPTHSWAEQVQLSQEISAHSVVVHELNDSSYGLLHVPRHIAQSAVACFGRGFPIMVVGDSQLLIDGLLGHACIRDAGLTKNVAVAHIALQKLTAHFHVQPFMGHQLARQVPRSDNSAADAAANKALDVGSFLDVHVEETVRFLCELSEHTCNFNDVGILFSFDGAARGNPGPAASGVCAWWGYWRNNMFEAKGLLLERGFWLGSATNNAAESHGLATSMKAALRWHYWVIEQCTDLARHSMRESDVIRD